MIARVIPLTRNRTFWYDLNMKFNFETPSNNEESKLDKVKKAGKKVILSAALAVGLSAGSGEAVAQNQGDVFDDKVENIEQIKDFESYFAEIEKDPELFFYRIKNDEVFAEEVSKSFKSNANNFNKISNYRIKYFVEQGKARMTSGDSSAPELNGEGVILEGLEDIQKYKDKYPEVSKMIGYDVESDTDIAVKNLVKHIQYKL